jgi:ligand-binding SRPBCC domain-containing protein
MNFIIKTAVGSTTKEAVMAGFTSDLFLKLAPPFPKLKLLRYDGCEKGHEVHLQMDFLLYKRNWISVITENGVTETEFYFVDEGTLVPAPIKNWKHKHIIRQLGNSVEIEDNVTYSCGNMIIDKLIFLPIFFLFLYRKPIYKNYFHPKI